MGSRRIFDLSPRLSPATPVYPGDVPLSVEWTATLAGGDGAAVAAIRTTTHLGSHADAPCHTEAEGAGIGELPLAPFLGPCRVVEVPAVPLLGPEHLPPALPGDPARLLLKTGSVADGTSFPNHFTALAPEAARLLAARRLLLLGLDTPSVDPPGSPELPAHHALAGAGVVILEGLLLAEVPPGLYELIALPLRLTGLDASPVRAVLRDL